MSLIPAQTYMVSVANNQVETFLKNLASSGLAVEFLKPAELDSKWKDVISLERPEDASLDKNLAELEKILKANQKKGFVAGFTDNRFVAGLEQIEEAKQKQDQIFNVAKLLNKQVEFKNEQIEIEKFASTLGDKEALFGENLAKFQSRLQNFVTETLNVLTKVEQDLNVDLEEFSNLEVEIVKIKNLEAAIFEQGALEIIQTFLEKNPDLAEIVFTKNEIITHLQEEYSENNETLSNLDVDSEDISEEWLMQFAALHASFEIQKRALDNFPKFFKVKESSVSSFAFITVSGENKDKAEQFFEDKQTAYQPIDWKDEIVNWQNNTGFRSFKEIAQSIGTIDQKETDPSPILGIFFMIFFAFCLNDALYGLILSAFTGYFLFFTNLKKQFQNIFGLFFYSGLATVILGMLTNSWAGNLFNSALARNLIGHTAGSTVINDILSRFQLIEVINTDPESLTSAPLNDTLGDLSPIIFMMLLAVTIGFANQFFAYLLRISTALKRGDYNVATGQITWIFFLFAAVSSIALASSDLQIIGFSVLGVSILSLFIFNQAQNFIGKALGFLFGPRGLYGIVQLGADLMSYTRIVAIGLTGGVIASIVNLLANILYESTNPFIGIILATIMLIVGHIFNFALSLFGAYINPLRLSYVEFMPKFFLGQGRQVKTQDMDLTYLKVLE